MDKTIEERVEKALKSHAYYVQYLPNDEEINLIQLIRDMAERIKELETTISGRNAVVDDLIKSVIILSRAEMKLQDKLRQLEEKNAQLREAQKWQDIKTAPKNGYPIYAIDNKSHLNGKVCFVNGDWEQINVHGECMGIGFYPTHWMPLPQTSEKE